MLAGTIAQHADDHLITVGVSMTVYGSLLGPPHGSSALSALSTKLRPTGL